MKGFKRYASTFLLDIKCYVAIWIHTVNTNKTLTLHPPPAITNTINIYVSYIEIK